MRQCLQETMLALEDEYKEKEGDAAAGAQEEEVHGEDGGRGWKQFEGRKDLGRQAGKAREMASEAPGSSVTPEDVGCA